MLKRLTLLLILICFLSIIKTYSQCSLCTRTAQQMGEKPAQGLNGGILYLMAVPFAIAGFIGYKWWRKERT